jgi:VWFA-related protein
MKVKERCLSAPRLILRPTARQRCFVSVVWIILLISLSAAAQQNPAAESKQSSPAIWITARNKDGSPAQISAHDLEIKIDGKQLAVAEVHRASPPLRYCLLLDTSGSQRAFLKTQRDEAVALLSKIPQAGRDYGFVVDFADEAYLDGESADPQKLIKAMKPDARGGTAMYSAMVACTGHMSKGAPDAALHLMFVLSDGEDNASKVNREAAERSLISGRVRIYAIGEKDAFNPGSGAAAAGEKNLKHFAELTGGKNYLPGKEWTVDKIVDDIAGDLAALYAVTPASDQPLAGDRYYKLEIKSKSKDVTIIAPRAYFMPQP